MTFIPYGQQQTWDVYSLAPEGEWRSRGGTDKGGLVEDSSASPPSSQKAGGNSGKKSNKHKNKKSSQHINSGAKLLDAAVAEGDLRHAKPAAKPNAVSYYSYEMLGHVEQTVDRYL